MTTKHQLAYFFEKPDKTEFGRLKLQFKVEIGEILDYDEEERNITPTNKMHDNPATIVQWTTESMSAEKDYRLRNRKKQHTISSRIREVIAEVAALPLSAYDRMQIAHQIHEAIRDKVLLNSFAEKKKPAKKKGVKKK
jgi:hypothetical protein